jgi:hypothetical protein
MAYTMNLERTPRAPAFRLDEEIPGMLLLGFGLGFPVKEDRHLLPTSLRQTDDRKLADVLPLPGLNAVSEKFRVIVEFFEPDVHEFFPVQLRRQDGTPYAQRYYIFNSCQRFDAVLLNRQSAKTPYSRTYQDRRPPFIGLSEWNLTLSRRKIAGRHLWRSQYMAMTHFASQELGDAMKREKVEFLDLHDAPELDVAWDPMENVGPVIAWIEAHPGTRYRIND